MTDYNKNLEMVNFHYINNDGKLNYLYTDFNASKDNSVRKIVNILNYSVFLMDTQKFPLTHECVENCPCKMNNLERWKQTRTHIETFFESSFSEDYPIKTFSIGIRSNKSWLVIIIIFKCPSKCSLCSKYLYDDGYEFDIINDTTIYCDKCVGKIKNGKKPILYLGNQIEVFRLHTSGTSEDRVFSESLYSNNTLYLHQQYSSYNNFKTSLDELFKETMFECYNYNKRWASTILLFRSSFDDYNYKQPSKINDILKLYIDTVIKRKTKKDTLELED